MKTIAKKTPVFLGLFLLMTPGSFASEPKIVEGEYSLDTSHSKVGFEVSHLVISSVEGKFDKYSGTISLGKKIDDMTINAEIKADSINTGEGERDKHLKGPDFFDTAKFATLQFKSTKISGPANDLVIKGDLTIHGVTKPVMLTGKYNGVAVDPWGNTKIGLSAHGKISRKEFGLVWTKMIEAGPVVGDEITLDFKIEAAKILKK